MSWFDRKAAQARLAEIDSRIEELRREQAAIHAILGDGGVPPSLPSRPTPAGGVAPKRRGRKPGRGGAGPTMVDLLAEAAKTAPSKAWTVGELIAVVRKSHPDRVSGENASALVSAALAQEAKKSSARFTSRKTPGQRARLYRLA